MFLLIFRKKEGKGQRERERERNMDVREQHLLLASFTFPD